MGRSKERLLLLGAAGTLGSAFQAILKGSDLVAWDKADLRLDHLDQIEPALRQVMPTVVINAAAFTQVDEAERHEDQARLINTEAVGELARVCAKRRAVMVQFSTDYVFDGMTSSGYDEDAVPHPLNAYGRTKLAGEHLLRSSGCEYLLVRTSRLFGHSGSPRSKKNFVAAMIELAQTDSTIEVVDDEIASPTYAPDLAAATLALLRKNERGIVHRTNHGSCTWFGWAQEIFAQLSKRVTLVPVPAWRFHRPARRPRFSELTSSRFPPLRPWPEALHDYLQVTNARS